MTNYKLGDDICSVSGKGDVYFLFKGKGMDTGFDIGISCSGELYKRNSTYGYYFIEQFKDINFDVDNMKPKDWKLLKKLVEERIENERNFI